MNSKFLRLIYPQWQGANISAWFPEFKPEVISRGYFLGSHLLNFLCPPTANAAEVPVRTEAMPREEKDGILDKDFIIEQMKSALDILCIENPDKVLTLGGDCAVSVAPFSYLAQKHGDDVGIIWIDAHPDITMPGDPYNGFHAMALAACLGECDKDIKALLPGTVQKQKVLTVGVRNYEREQIVERFKDWGLKNVTVSELVEDPEAVSKWLSSAGIKKVMVHLDLDVLEPSELRIAVGHDADGLTVEKTAQLLKSIASSAEVVGMTVAEPMPTRAILLQKLLWNVPMAGM